MSGDALTAFLKTRYAEVFQRVVRISADPQSKMVDLHGRPVVGTLYEEILPAITALPPLDVA